MAYLSETLKEEVKAVIELKNMDERIKTADGLVREVIVEPENYFKKMDYTFTARLYNETRV